MDSQGGIPSLLLSLALSGANYRTMPQESFALLHTLHAAEHTEDITSIAWSPDDSMLLLGVECAIKIYDVQVRSSL